MPLRPSISRFVYLISILLLLAGLLLFHHHHYSPSILPPSTSPPPTTLHPVPLSPSQPPSIAKANLLYPHSAFSALQPQHATHPYPLYPLRTPLVKGAPNTLLHLLSLLLAELQKPPETQVAWLLYFAPGVLLSNAVVPLHVFVPPVTQDYETFKYVVMMAAKTAETDAGGERLGAGVLWVRVSDAAVRIVVATLGEVYEGAREGGDEEEQDRVATALQRVLERDGNRKAALYHPPGWYNSTDTVPNALFTQPYFSSAARRLRAMQDFVAAAPPTPSALTEASERITRETEVYWATVAEARRVLNTAKEMGHTEDKGKWQDLVRETREWVEMRAWEVEELGKRVAELREGLEIE